MSHNVIDFELYLFVQITYKNFETSVRRVYAQMIFHPCANTCTIRKFAFVLQIAGKFKINNL